MIHFRKCYTMLPIAGAVLVLAGCGSSSSSGSKPTAQSAALATSRPYPTVAVPPTAVISGGSAAAIVNGHPIPMSLYRLNFNFSQRRFAGSPGVTSAQIANQTMEQIIGGEIARQYAVSHGITVTSADVNRVVQQQITGMRGAPAFNAALARYGLTLATFKQLIVPSLYEQKVMQRVTPVKPTMVEQARVRHILIGTTLQGKQLRSNAAAKARAETVLKQLKNGGNFAALAQKYSDDPGKVQNGGYYTVHPGDQMVPQFLSASFAQQIGKPTIIKTVYGYHVFEVMSRGKGPAPATQQQQAQAQRFTVWIKSQEAKAKIQRIATVKSGKTK